MGRVFMLHKSGLLAASFVLVAASMACRMNETPAAQVKDAEIGAQLKGKLASDINASTLTDISVNVTNGVVTLSGQVKSGENKRKAEEIAHNLNGVGKVNNELQVATP
jgi:hyperosmotically inducible protein